MLSISGFLVPHDAQVCAHMAGAAFCKLAGFDTCDLRRNDNFRPIEYVRSTSDAHDALFHPLFEDSYLEPLEAFDGRTLYDQLNHIEPTVEGVFEFHVTLMGQDPDIARAHLNLLLTNLAAVNR